MSNFTIAFLDMHSPLDIIWNRTRQKIEFKSSHGNGSFDQIHNSANCIHRCSMDAYIFVFSSTEAASTTEPMVEIHGEPQVFLDVMLPGDDSVIPAEILPLALDQSFTLLSMPLEEAKQQRHIATNRCGMLPLRFTATTRETTRHDVFFQALSPYLMGRGFIVQSEMCKLDSGGDQRASPERGGNKGGGPGGLLFLVPKKVAVLDL